LTRLGKEAVRRYYEWQLAGPHDYEFIGMFDNGILQGYAVGGISRGAMSGFLKQNRAFLVCEVLKRPWLLLGKEFRHRIVVGLRALVPKPRPRNAGSLKSPARSFGILAIAISPEFQGKGIGKLLMDYLEIAATKRGFSRMHLTVASGNKNAIAFYHRLCWKRQSGGVDSHKMEKELLARPPHDPVVKSQSI
jgi:ribosomal protein S18 acetylase RimI-like enzyme